MWMRMRALCSSRSRICRACIWSRSRSCATHHVLRSDYCTVRLVDAGRDAVDIALTNRCCAGDIVVTQDFGLAMFALAKGAYVIHSWG